MLKNVVIVGGGLFGCMAAKLARANRCKVALIDDSRQYRASPASGCVLAPSWLSAIPKDEVAHGLSLLDRMYGLHDMTFRADLGVKFKAQRVITSEVLEEPTHIGTVVGIDPERGAVTYLSRAGTRVTLRGYVLVAAGIWCGELVKGVPPIKGLYGASLRVSGQLPEPRLHVYAPYKQAVAFNMDAKSMWFGDGTALIEKTWKVESERRVMSTLDRAVGLLGPFNVRTVKTHTGARPYIAGKMGYFAQVGDRCWVSTGGAKNGTLLAALQAEKFVKALS